MRYGRESGCEKRSKFAAASSIHLRYPPFFMTVPFESLTESESASSRAFSDAVPVTYSRSLARVRATYRTRISSSSCESPSLFAIACLTGVSYRAKPVLSDNFSAIPRPLSETMLCLRSFSLNFLPVPQRKTTGNSRPLDWCMVMSLTAPVPADDADGTLSLALLSMMSFIYRMKL